jgi:hypothetical protein
MQSVIPSTNHPDTHPRWRSYTLKDALTLLVSPTRFAVEQFHTKPIRTWNWIFRGILAAWLIGLWFSGTGEVVRHMPWYLVYGALWLFPFSRVNELALGFYQDAIQRFKGPPSRTKMAPVDRLVLLVAAYFEVAAQFGILYFCALPSGNFSKDFHSIIHAVYYSVVTITTVGYGDITPQKSWAQIMCMYELAVGFIVITFALGSYLASLPGEQDRLQTATSKSNVETGR